MQNNVCSILRTRVEVEISYKAGRVGSVGSSFV